MLSKIKYAFVVIITCTTLSAFSSTSVSQELVIKGKVKNSSQGFWDFGLSTFFDQETISIPLDKEGNFIKKIQITCPQDLFISIGGGISFFVLPGDVLTINWDENDEQNTFSIKSNIIERQREIDLVYKTALKFNEKRSSLFKVIGNSKLSAEEKLVKIDEAFKIYINDLVSSGKPTTNAQKIIADAYFEFYINYINSLNKKPGLENHYQLNLKPLLTGAWKKYEVSENDLNNDQLMSISPLYRIFVANKMNAHKPDGYTMKFSSSGMGDTPVKYAMSGLQLLKSKKILNWFLTRTLMSAYNYYDFENAERAYQMYHATVTDSFFADTLRSFHDKISRLKPGNNAPNFTLLDLEGKQVSLSDFKGKIIYIDFWGIYCAPCIDEIQNYSPKIQEKYKDKDIVFINICVDTKVEEDWKNKIKDLGFKGTHLIAKGWTNNQVCKDYNISGIPHYVLIDKEGKIISSNAARPSFISRGIGRDPIEIALK